MSMKVRIFSIAQLCIAFTIVLWHLSQPFVGDLFQAKAHLLVFDEVMGNIPAAATVENEERAEINRQRYQMLQKSDQRLIQTGYSNALTKKSTPFLAKLKASFIQVATGIPPFEQAWLLLSIIIPILLLKQVEGSKQAVWLLPLITLFYIADNQLTGTTPSLTPQERLFPTEQHLLEKYVAEPLSSSIPEQHVQLKKGWNLYLIETWGHQTPSKDPQEFQKQISEAEYAFTLARAKTIASYNPKSAAPHHREPLSILLAFLIWNLAFALSTIEMTPQLKKS